jgi:hypothetical protein
MMLVGIVGNLFLSPFLVNIIIGASYSIMGVIFYPSIIFIFPSSKKVIFIILGIRYFINANI